LVRQISIFARRFYLRNNIPFRMPPAKGNGFSISGGDTEYLDVQGSGDKYGFRCRSLERLEQPFFVTERIVFASDICDVRIAI